MASKEWHLRQRQNILDDLNEKWGKGFARLPSEIRDALYAYEAVRVLLAQDEEMDHKYGEAKAFFRGILGPKAPDAEG